LAFRNRLLTPISAVTAHLLSALLFSLAVVNIGCISTERTGKAQLMFKPALCREESRCSTR
jgi:hypothetical protein